MHRLLRPRSKTFRVMLSLALLAWASLAFGMSSHGQSHGQLMQMGSALAASSHATANCDDGPTARVGLHDGQAPAMPMGQRGCCHGGCHCLAACGAVMTVPRSFTLQQYAQAPLPVLESANPALALITPPLRPPII